MADDPEVTREITPVATAERHVEMSLFPDVAPDRPVGYIVPSVFVGTNADLMSAVAPMYLTGSVMDCTYGEGKWWTRFRPAPFVAHDLHKVDGVDFTDLPEDEATYDAVCFDPPYIPNGGFESSTRQDFRDAFGITTAKGGEARLWAMIGAGVAECARVLKPGGFLLVKCMDFVYADGLTLGHRRVLDMADHLGLRCHDLIVHHTGSGPGGHNIFTPKRARRHHSYLLVFTKVGKR
jgi:SAM-dependent methyltransferase